MTEYEKHCCRVCGLHYPNYLPYGESGDTATFDICKCCGVEWGYEDCQPSAAKRYRQQWIENGAGWFHPKNKPADWNLEAQLPDVPNAYADFPSTGSAEI